MDIGRAVAKIRQWMSPQPGRRTYRHPAEPAAGQIRWSQDRPPSVRRARRTHDCPYHSVMVSSARTREIAHLLVQVRDWAARQSDIDAVALAGSWAHGNARMDSDLDLVVLCLEPERYLGDSAWSRELGNPILLDTRSWGPLTELRFILPTGLEIDFGVAPVSWAAIDPVDDGTRQVVQDGISILHDPHRHLAHLIRACQTDCE